MQLSELYYYKDINDRHGLYIGYVIFSPITKHCKFHKKVDYETMYQYDNTIDIQLYNADMYAFHEFFDYPRPIELKYFMNINHSNFLKLQTDQFDNEYRFKPIITL